MPRFTCGQCLIFCFFKILWSACLHCDRKSLKDVLPFEEFHQDCKYELVAGERSLLNLIHVTCISKVVTQWALWKIC